MTGEKTKSLWADPKYRRKQMRAKRLKKAKELGYEAAKLGAIPDKRLLYKAAWTREQRGVKAIRSYMPRVLTKGNDSWKELEAQDREWKLKHS